ncbi:MAG: hypothetical protein ACRENL_11280 [Candidatus Dormibacteria bacterium]
MTRAIAMRRCASVGAALVVVLAALLPLPASAEHGSHSAAHHQRSETPAIQAIDRSAERGRADDRASTDRGRAGNAHRGATGPPRESSSLTASSSDERGPRHGSAAISGNGGGATPAAVPPRPVIASPGTATSSAPAALRGPRGSAGVAPASAATHPHGPSVVLPTQRLPVLVLPAPSQPTVLEPVPLLVPAINGGNGQASGGLSWKWFLALGLLDLGLIAGILIRRRGPSDRPGVG